MGWFDFLRGKKDVELGSTSANPPRPVQSTHRRKSVVEEIACWPDETPDDLQFMLSNGMDPRALDENGISALHWSAARGYDYVTHRLIDEGLDINGRMPTLERELKLCAGSTPLHLAAANGATDVARVLLSRGANPSLTNDHGDTPLHLAVGVSEKIATLLLQRGANVRCRDRHGYSPLHLAAYPRPSQRWGDSRDRAGYVYGDCGAIRYDPVKLVQVFLDAGLSPREETNAKSSPLHFACSPEGNGRIAALLIENGATLDQRDEKGRTPVDKAIEISNADVVKVLLDSGSPPPTKTSSTLIDELNKRQPTKERNELVTILVAVGILDESEVQQHKLIWPDDEFGEIFWSGGNPSVISADSALELAEMLLSRQCDINATNKDGDTPLLIAAGTDMRSFGQGSVFNRVFWRPQ